MSFIAAAVTAATVVTGYNANKARKSAGAAAEEQARIAQEAENQRRREAEAEAERIRQAEISRQNNITAGQQEISTLFGQFDDNFYNQRSQGYLDYSMPTLDRQYEDQLKSLTANLARTGNLSSSLRGDLTGQLQRQYDTSKLSLADAARRYSDEAKSSVMGAKSRLMESNASLADPGTIRNMAQAQADGLKATPQYQSLSQMISDLASGVQTGPKSASSASGGGVSLFAGGPGGSGNRLVS